MEKIKFRRARLNDVPKILVLGKEAKELIASKTTKFYDKRELVDWIKKPKDNILLVAERDKVILGFIFAKIMSPNWCMIDGILVKRDERGKRIGTHLLERLNSILKKKKNYFLQLFVDAHCQKAFKFWQKKNFRRGKIFVWFEKDL